MTNGEMIQKVFNCEVCEPIIEDDIIHVIFADKKDSAIGFNLSWWKMEYKEPTTKNDLGVDKTFYERIMEYCKEHFLVLVEKDVWDDAEKALTTKNDLGVEHHKQNIQAYAHDFGVSEEQAEKELAVRTNLEVDCISSKIAKEMHLEVANMKKIVQALSSVTSQLSSGLDKNSKKLGKDFGELDCISRADAKKAIIEHQYSDSFCEEHIIDHSINTSMALIALSDLPPVTPIRPKGHWKFVQRGKYIDICCSNCKTIRIKEYAYNYTIDQLNKEDLKECFECADMRYCPYCGSDNREVEE